MSLGPVLCIHDRGQRTGQEIRLANGKAELEPLGDHTGHKGSTDGAVVAVVSENGVECGLREY